MNSLTRSGRPSEPRAAVPRPPPQPVPGSPGAAAAGRALAQMDAELPQAVAQTAPDAPHDRRRHLAHRSPAAGAGGVAPALGQSARPLSQLANGRRGGRGALPALPARRLRGAEGAAMPERDGEGNRGAAGSGERCWGLGNGSWNGGDWGAAALWRSSEGWNGLERWHRACGTRRSSRRV